MFAHNYSTCFQACALKACFCECRNGSIRARHIKLVKSALPDRFQGVVCSMKDNYGFIERSDIVKEIFFHYSEFQGNVNELLLGDDVEFAIQTRNVSTNSSFLCLLKEK